VAHPSVQSIARLHVTGTSAPATTQGVVVNCVAQKPGEIGVTTGSITLFARPSTDSGASSLSLVLTGVNIFDGGKWQVSFGRQRRDEFNFYQQSRYFLRASKFSPAGLESFHTTASFFNDVTNNTFENVTAAYNASGTFLTLGSQSLDTTSGRLLNAGTSTVPADAKVTTFTGKLSSIRFYSKALTEQETKVHARNFKSVGVENPEVNFNFVTNASGSFSRLRVDASLDQPVTDSLSGGTIQGFDFSQNSLHFEGTGFEASKRTIKPERFNFEVLSSKFESGENPNKVRIRSFKDPANVKTYGTAFAPLYDIPQNDQPNDDKRIAIEISVTQGLDEDIMNIFGTLNVLDNIIGSPEMVFAQEYPSLRNLRRIYFNRLTEKVNFLSFFEFFKFFDDTIGDLLEQMLPSDSRFAGSSYVIEPHALERAKFTYKYSDMYLGEEDRAGKSPILLQQLVGVLRKR
jgi:nitrogen fixation protein FixH